MLCQCSQTFQPLGMQITVSYLAPKFYKILLKWGKVFFSMTTGFAASCTRVKSVALPMVSCLSLAGFFMVGSIIGNTVLSFQCFCEVCTMQAPIRDMCTTNSVLILSWISWRSLKTPKNFTVKSPPLQHQCSCHTPPVFDLHGRSDDASKYDASMITAAIVNKALALERQGM